MRKYWCQKKHQGVSRKKVFNWCFRQAGGEGCPNLRRVMKEGFTMMIRRWR